ncbi:heavy metal translocating P-type ATPase [Prosthecomicrobium sp. N25]|uniref:heavy metal translocating P-type ATPase n=1 Tax=Prosthecomicrobium sp. N25 TaxID=3129254 RepID=UPI0030774885
MTGSAMRTRFKVEGMDCASCATKVETAVRRQPGVSDVSVSVTAESMTVTHGPDLDVRALARVIGGLGYPTAPLVDAPRPVETPHPRGEAGHRDHDHDHGSAADDRPWWRTPKVRLTLGSGCALVAAYGLGHLVPALGSVLFLAALAVGLLPIARRAVLAAGQGTPFSIEMLMTIAAGGAVVIGAVEEAAMVVFLFLVGELLEGVAAARARASIRGLSALVPSLARLERGGLIEEVPAASLLVGSIILVRPGDRIPADGDIVKGESAVDEAPVTGESVPKRKSEGDTVYAGTVNGDGLLRVRVTAAAGDNTIARVVRLVEEAQESKAPTERFIDRFSRAYTPAVVAAAALVAVVPPLLAGAPWTDWIYKGLALLLIGCPCALVISTPAAIAAGLSAGARRGLLMKGGAVLEGVGRITTVALDKTGTLTSGKPQVTDVVGLRGFDERSVLSLAAALEFGSSHPLAQAVTARAKADRVPVPPAIAVAAVPGRGVEGRVGGHALFLGSAAAAAAMDALSEPEAGILDTLAGEGKSVAVLVRDGQAVGLLALRDEPREDARRGLDALKAAGITPIMLTGDNRRTAEAVAGSLGIEPRAELLPQDKQRIVRELQAQGHRVGKVGDGINDAPALAAAHVGIAMGGGTDVALETADAAVLHGRVMDVARMVALSRAVMANIRQNIAIALGLKAVFLVTTILGLTGLWPAILADTGATVLVTANAMRLLAWRPAA